MKEQIVDNFFHDMEGLTQERNLFSKVILAKAVGDEKLGWIKMFPDLQDHLGQVQGKVQRQRQPEVGQVKGQPKRLIFKNKSCWG